MVPWLGNYEQCWPLRPWYTRYHENRAKHSDTRSVEEDAAQSVEEDAQGAEDEHLGSEHSGAPSRSGEDEDAAVETEAEEDDAEERVFESEEPTLRASANTKGKGKAKAITQDDVSSLSKTQIQAEIKELEGLKEDLALKVGIMLSSECVRTR